MKIALHSISYAGYFYDGGHIPLEEMIPKAAKLAYEGIEIMAKRPIASPLDLDAQAAKAIRKLADSHNMEIAIIAAYADFTKPQPVDREKEFLYVRECMRLANDLGCSLVRLYGGGDALHPGIGISFQQQWDLAKEGLKTAAQMAKDYGLLIALEPHTSVIQTYEDVLDMVEQVGSERIKVCLDPPLLAMRNEPIEKAILATGDLLVHSHVMDFVRKPPLVEYHSLPGLAISECFPIDPVPLGEGIVDLKTFVRACKQIGYKGSLSFEVCTPFHIHHRRPTIADVDQRVEQAIEYLRALLHANS